MSCVIIEIPNIPLKEAKKALDYLNQKINIKEKFIWKDGIAIFFNEENVVIKGPKMTEVDKFKQHICENYAHGEFFEEKNILKYKTALSTSPSLDVVPGLDVKYKIITGPPIDTKDFKKTQVDYFIDKMMNTYYIQKNLNDLTYMENFIYENDYIYCHTKQNINVIDLIKNITWIKPIKMYEDYCCRPVKNIILSQVNNNETYCGVKPIIKDFTVTLLINYYISNNVIINLEEKTKMILEALPLSMQKLICKSKIEELVHETNIPHLIFIPLKEKYKQLPDKLVAFILAKEQNLLPFYEKNILIGFYSIINNINCEIDYFNIAIDSRLEDLFISYKRDKNIVKFDNQYYDQELHKYIFQLIEDLNITLDKNKILFLLQNYKNDFNTTLVEEYPSLLGIISYYVYGELPNPDKQIQDAFLSYSGEILNNYGLVLFLSEKLYFLTIVTAQKQLATATKDPFATKVIADSIIKILLHHKHNLLPLSEELSIFFLKRISIYFSNYQYSSLLIYDKLKLLEIEEYLQFFNSPADDTMDNFTKIKNLINRLKFFIKQDHKQINGNNLPELPSSLPEQINYIEHILNTINVKDNPEYLEIFRKFVSNVQNIVHI